MQSMTQVYMAHPQPHAITESRCCITRKKTRPPAIKRTKQSGLALRWPCRPLTQSAWCRNTRCKIHGPCPLASQQTPNHHAASPSSHSHIRPWGTQITVAPAGESDKVTAWSPARHRHQDVWAGHTV